MPVDIADKIEAQRQEQQAVEEELTAGVKCNNCRAVGMEYEPIAELENEEERVSRSTFMHLFHCPHCEEEGSLTYAADQVWTEDGFCFLPKPEQVLD